MSIFGNIMGKIFGSSPAQAAESTQPTAGAQTPNPVGTSTANAAPSSGAQKSVDVAQVLDGLADKAGQTLHWRTSIVDLMKLLGLDSSLASRKELAGELKYTGDTNDSATMNMWLHKQVMAKLAANGGKVPDDLR